MLGTSLGSLIGGYEMNLHGYRVVYYHASIFISIIFCLHLASAISLRKFSKRTGLFNRKNPLEIEEKLDQDKEKN